SWIRLVTLAAHYPRKEWAAVCIGRARRAGPPRERLLGSPESALDVLRDLVTMYDAGRREPIPLPLKTSYAWAEARYNRGSPEREARFKWNTGKFPGENEQPAHDHVWGKRSDLSVLMTPVQPGEECEDENTRLGAYAARLWLPMLHAERDPE
ncbi:MAG: exodeoxyribonuclease V subunit gamma, partial [Mycobacterium sp.]